MAEMVKTPAPLPPSFPRDDSSSAWAPLREPIFRSMWIAAIISYIGTWMQAVGAGWMMTMLTIVALDGRIGAGGRSSAGLSCDPACRRFG